jgi:thiol:disulfide interchange protein DsbD
MKKLLVYFLFVTILFSANKFLEPKDAMKITQYTENDYVVVDVKIAKDIYLYEDKFRIELLNFDKKLDISLPKAKKYKTEFSDDMVFDNSFIVKIPFAKILNQSKNQLVDIKVSYQGCSKAGVCYAPENRIFNIDLSSTNKKIDIKKDDIDVSLDLSENDILSILENSSFITILIIFFVLGLLLSLTPCVYPIIPILSSIIVSKSKNGTKMSVKNGFILSLIYVLSMSVAYSIAGILAGAFGTNLQTAFQNPYIIVAFSGIFIALALSMFGYFEITFPSSWQTKINNLTNKNGKNGFLDVIIMGFLSALIVGPCIAPPLAGALLYISQTGDLVLGGIALFVLSFGTGIPLLVVGAGAGKIIPKAGNWMQTINKIFGVVMVGIAIWMLSRIISESITMILWSALVIGSSVYMGIFDCNKNISKYIKFISVMMMVYGVTLFIGGISGNKDVLNPLENIITPKQNSSINQNIKIDKLNFVYIKDMKHLERVLKTKEPIMIDFYASWCTYCNLLDKKVFVDKEVISSLKNFKLYKISQDVVKDDWKKMLAMYNSFQPPVLIFYKNGVELKDAKVTGFIEPDKLVEKIDKFYK